jgi:hypothetical protein
MARARASNGAVAALLLLAAGIAGCASPFEREYEAAEQLRTQAADAGYEWIETGAILQQARESYDTGDIEEALALVRKARFQAEAAIEQAGYEAETWQQRVLR